MKYPFELAPLPYSYDALEPVIDAETMKIHHDKHHQAYVDNLNKLLAERVDLQTVELEDLLKTEAGPVKNNAGGVYNHNLFWEMMKPVGSTQMGEKTKAVLIENFGSVEEFMNKFEQAGLSRFGSGWVWLVKNPDGKLGIVSTANQDSPIEQNMQVLLGNDVWEHAYYLKYQNRRAEYLKAWWQLVDWDKVEDKCL